MTSNNYTSFPFSFSKKITKNIQYFKKTNPKNTLNRDVENFVLTFIEKPKNIVKEKVKRGRPGKGVIITDDEKKIPFVFPFKKSTILRIRKFKKKDNMPDLNANVEKYIKSSIPSRE